jgi:phosphoribosylaminoimidazole-succinocarboxamide synthase
MIVPIQNTQFTFQGQTGFYQGKVRDVYFLGEKMLIIASDRISAFDVVLPRPIPYKGQILTQIAQHFLQKTAKKVPNWLISNPDPNVSYGHTCQAYPVEMVVRGYLAGHAWRTYKSGLRTLCGVTLPDGLKENDPLPTPIITPTTKAKEGHDEDISREEILKQGIVPQAEYKQLEAMSLELFALGTAMAAERNLILVDTKYEFGKANNKIMVIDEINTPDSSRYFYKDAYESNQAKGLPQKQLSKEFVREWLIENNFQGKEGQEVPNMTDEKVTEISERYIELYEVITGKKFEKPSETDTLARIEKNIYQHIF